MAGYIGSKAVNLSTTGADINGDANIDGDLSFRDNDKAIFGAGSDLQIYHDGSSGHSIITESGGGALQLQGENLVLEKPDGTNYLLAVSGASGYVKLYQNGSQKLATTSTGVDITGTLTSDGLTVNSGTNNTVAKFESSDAGAFIILEDSGSTNDGNRIAVEGDVMSFATGDSEAMRLDSNGRVMIGGTTVTDVNMLNIQGSGASNNIGVAFNDTNTSKIYGIQNGGSQLRFHDYSASATRMLIDSSGHVGIGVTPSDSNSFGRALDVGSTTGGALYLRDVGGSKVGIVGQFNEQLSINSKQSDGNIGFYTGASNNERMRLDSSGRLLVGKTAQGLGTAGFEVEQSGQASFTQSGASCIRLNRLSSDGDIIQLRKDGSTVGTIGTKARTSSGRIFVGNSNTRLLFDNGVDAIIPANNDGNDRDNAIDLGASGARFDDIYATNGTIQTSDRNEKQDIAELSDAEQRVAVAAKGLMRKFRWRDAVEAKGDQARTHFGIIAQDLQAAFAAEGLDAGDYAMFISSTWTDEETGEERTRMGVRYSELLAFIIGAL